MESQASREGLHGVFDRAAAKAGEIEAEMKRIGYWRAGPPPAEAFQFKQAFAADTMAFPQWLQWVFLPKVRQLVRDRSALPEGSFVGTYAPRALEGDAKADPLVGLLSEFDAIFGTPRAYLAPDRPPRRLSPATVAALWTVVMVAAGILFAGYVSRASAPTRQERYTFAAHDPASGAYEAIDMTATAEGRAGKVRPREMVLRMYPGHAPVPGGDLTVDLRTLAYHYAEADGVERSGAFDAGAALAWFRRCGIEGDGPDGPKLKAEAAAVAALAEDARLSPAGLFDRLRGKPSRPPPRRPPARRVGQPPGRRPSRPSPPRGPPPARRGAVPVGR